MNVIECSLGEAGESEQLSGGVEVAYCLKDGGMRDICDPAAYSALEKAVTAKSCNQSSLRSQAKCEPDRLLAS